MRTTRGRFRFGAIVAALVVAGSLASCTSAKNTLGTSASACLRAVAVAPGMIGRTSTTIYSGVHYDTAKTIRSELEKISHAPLPPALVANKDAVCAVAYSGRFSRSKLREVWPPDLRRGRAVIVVLVATSDALLATVLLSARTVRYGRL